MKRVNGYRLKLVFSVLTLIGMTLNPIFATAQALTVTVDPGHGGNDPGAVGQAGVKEKDINFDMAQRLSKLLEASGSEVAMTRADDRTLTLVSRTDLAGQVNADLFISIHNNASTNQSITGTQVLYYYNPVSATTTSDTTTAAMLNSQNNKELAQSIQKRLLSTLGTVDRGLVVRNDLSVLRRATMPAVLVEVGFLSNLKEEQWLTREDIKQKTAQAIFQGIQDYLQTHPVEQNAFRDISNSWAKDYINLLAEKEIAQGSGNRFYPQRNISRAEVAALTVRALGLKSSPGASSFGDVPPMHWAAGEIAIAKEYGLIGGYEDGSFRPDEQVKRSEMSKMLAGALPQDATTMSLKPISDQSDEVAQPITVAAITGTSGEVSAAERVFQDIAGHWAQPYILRLATSGITSGYADGTFRPETRTTRGEMSAFIARLIDPALRIQQ